MNKNNRKYIRPAMQVIQLQRHAPLVCFSGPAQARRFDGWDNGSEISPLADGSTLVTDTVPAAGNENPSSVPPPRTTS